MGCSEILLFDESGRAGPEETMLLFKEFEIKKN
jgi:hypothetical protein